MEYGSIPLGLGMALAQNADAMEYFSSLPDSEKERIIAHTHTIQSRREMHQFVQSLAERKH
jgi:hypothetical protein